MLNNTYFGTQNLALNSSHWTPTEQGQPHLNTQVLLEPAIQRTDRGDKEFIHAAFPVSHSSGQIEPFSLQVVIYTQGAQKSPAEQCLQL